MLVQMIMSGYDFRKSQVLSCWQKVKSDCDVVISSGRVFQWGGPAAVSVLDTIHQTFPHWPQSSSLIVLYKARLKIAIRYKKTIQKLAKTSVFLLPTYPVYSTW